MKINWTLFFSGSAALLTIFLVGAIVFDSVSEWEINPSCKMDFNKPLLERPFQYLASDEKMILTWNTEKKSLTRFSIEDQKGNLILNQIAEAPVVCTHPQENCFPEVLFKQKIRPQPIQFSTTNGVFEVEIGQRKLLIPVQWLPNEPLKLGVPLGLCQKYLDPQTPRSWTLTKDLLIVTLPDIGGFGYYPLVPFFSGVPLSAPQHPQEFFIQNGSNWNQGSCSNLLTQHQDFQLDGSNDFMSLTHSFNLKKTISFFGAFKGTLFENHQTLLPPQTQQLHWLDSRLAILNPSTLNWEIYKSALGTPFEKVSQIPNLNFEKTSSGLPVQSFHNIYQSEDIMTVQGPSAIGNRVISLLHTKENTNQLQISELGSLPLSLFGKPPELVWIKQFNATTHSALFKQGRSLNGVQFSCKSNP